jgi:uncharacterized membrane protein YagU involved in acid resistance
MIPGAQCFLETPPLDLARPSLASELSCEVPMKRRWLVLICHLHFSMIFVFKFLEITSRLSGPTEV